MPSQFIAISPEGDVYKVHEGENGIVTVEREEGRLEAKTFKGTNVTCREGGALRLYFGSRLILFAPIKTMTSDLA